MVGLEGLFGSILGVFILFSLQQIGMESSTEALSSSCFWFYLRSGARICIRAVVCTFQFRFTKKRFIDLARQTVERWEIVNFRGKNSQIALPNRLAADTMMSRFWHCFEVCSHGHRNHLVPKSATNSSWMQFCCQGVSKPRYMMQSSKAVQFGCIASMFSIAFFNWSGFIELYFLIFSHLFRNLFKPPIFVWTES